MNFYRLPIIGIVLCVVASCATGTYKPASNSGALLYDPNPNPAEKAIWTGSKDSGGFASGFGRLKWFQGGNQVSEYEGSKVRGKWASYRKVPESEWSEPASQPSSEAIAVSSDLGNVYRGSSEQRFHSAYMNRDFATAIQMIRKREVTPNSMIATTTIRDGELELRQFVFNHKIDEDLTRSKANSYSGVMDAILKTNFSEKESFETYVAGMGLGGRLDVLEVALDNHVRMSGRTFTSLILPSAPNANAMLGWSCYGFPEYSDEKKRRIGTLVARVEKAGGGSFDDFDGGIRRRNNWVQSVREVIDGGVLLAAYAVAGGVLHAGDAVATGVKRTVQEGFATTPGSSYGGSSSSADPHTSKSSSSQKGGAVTKTFTVTSDARANQTGNEAGASGESSITVRGDDGKFTVRYRYNWPSSYLISAGRGKTLEGKSVSIQFEGNKATYISCGSGSGKCQIKSFSR